MGRNSDTFEAPGKFGTRDKIVELAVAGRKTYVKKCLTDAIASSPTKSHALLMKPEVNPSSPGALLVLSLKNNFLISSEEEKDSMA